MHMQRAILRNQRVGAPNPSDGRVPVALGEQLRGFLGLGGPVLMRAPPPP